MKFLSGGMLTTVQDLGRIGYKQYGMSVSGAVDQRSAVLGNILVGNPRDEAVLEITLLGPTIQFIDSVYIAITGGDLSPTLNGAQINMYQAILIQKGDTLKFGSPKSGCRSYLAVAGGLDIGPIMGSRSTFMKGQIGGVEGRKLKKDDVITFREPKTRLPNTVERHLIPEDFSGTEKVLRVVMGPQEEAFTEAGVHTFLSTPYTVTTQSDRMGYRLEGQVIAHVKDANIISDGITFGSVQIPDAGTPIVMLADCQTTGGYAKIATVISADFPVIAQSKPGDTLRFELITVQDAQQLYCDWLMQLDYIEEMMNHLTPTYTVFAEEHTLPGEILTAVIINREGRYHVDVNGVDYICTVKELPT